jgi:hypothetical protein
MIEFKFSARARTWRFEKELALPTMATGVQLSPLPPLFFFFSFSSSSFPSPFFPLLIPSFFFSLGLQLCAIAPPPFSLLLDYHPPI